MGFISRSLEVAEWAFLVGSIVGAVAVVNGKPIYTVTSPITATLFYNVINRTISNQKNSQSKEQQKALIANLSVSYQENSKKLQCFQNEFDNSFQNMDISNYKEELNNKIILLDEDVHNLKAETHLTNQNINVNKQAINTQLDLILKKIQPLQEFCKNELDSSFKITDIDNFKNDLISMASFIEQKTLKFNQDLSSIKKETNDQISLLIQNVKKIQNQALDSTQLIQLNNKIVSLELFVKALPSLTVFGELERKIEQAVANLKNDKPLENYIIEVNQLLKERLPQYATQIIVNRDNSREVLKEAIEIARERLILVCPWICEPAITEGNIIELLKNFLQREGTILEIGWGNRNDIEKFNKKSKFELVNRQEFINFYSREEKPWKYTGMKLLDKLKQDYPQKVKMKLLGCHAKFLICDTQFATVGSHNFLTSGSTSLEFELGLKTNETKIIEELINLFDYAPNLEMFEEGSLTKSINQGFEDDIFGNSQSRANYRKLEKPIKIQNKRFEKDLKDDAPF